MHFSNLNIYNKALKVFQILLLILMIISVSFIVYFTGGTSGAWAQLNFITIILAAYFFREKGSLSVALISGLILGPLMPKNRILNIMQNPSNWIFRIFIYLFIAYFISLLFNKNDKLNKKISDSHYISHFTGLYNSNKLIEDLNQIIKKGDNFHLLFYKIKNLEEISKYVDSNIINELIKNGIEAAKEIYDNNLIYSLNLDEYIIIVKNSNEATIRDQVNYFINQYKKPIEANNHLISLVIKVGLMRYNGEEISSSNLINRLKIAADQGMFYESGIYKYDYQFKKEKILFHEISSSLNNAISNNEFYLVYQPIVDINNDTISNCEVLIRWNRGTREAVGPNIFIKIAEQTGFIKTLTNWIISTSLEQYNELKNKGLDIKQSINVTATELIDDNFTKQFINLMQEKNINCNNFGIEITERVVSKDNIKLRDNLIKLQNNKVLVEIDDFGTGYNSLMNLGEIPFDIIKIDKYFIDKIFDEEMKIIIRELITLIHSIGRKVIAEGVETKEQFLLLKELKCDKIQGYYFSKPLEKESFFNYCKSFNINNYL